MRRSNARRLIRRVLVRRAPRYPVINRGGRSNARDTDARVVADRVANSATRSTTKTLNLERRTRASPRAQLSTHVTHRCRSSRKRSTRRNGIFASVCGHDSSDVSYVFPRYIVNLSPHRLRLRNPSFFCSNDSNCCDPWMKYCR